ncbi:hypothetical protein ATN81_14965 [Agrobacterium pusense]|uniref:hypothetical protein n=1 Tax=Agrobacterium pusense TaxID=648995 RepID=UPI000927CE95|nr:hypothetical protein [Agrobacterium pusense]OJH54169.1 hypothetical protein ATN81_14965 [Agrobacterium pusense]OJH58583.1 hypothetical protein BA725_16695 [Agrobacterium pusense]
MANKEPLTKLQIEFRHKIELEFGLVPDSLAFPTGENWDRNLSKDEVLHLNPSDKQRRPLVSLIRKVLLLQHWSTRPAELQAEGLAPLKRPALRQWHDPDRGLWTWDDVLLDKPSGKNATIVAVFKTAADDIQNIGKTAGGGQRSTIKKQREIIYQLELQIISLLEEVRELRNMRRQ